MDNKGGQKKMYKVAAEQLATDWVQGAIYRERK